jgi:hypothetical protein
VVASESGEVGNPGTLGMTKGRVALPFKLDAAEDGQQVPPLRYAPVGMTLLFGVSLAHKDKIIGSASLRGLLVGF